MRTELVDTHPEYKNNENRWEFYLRSYMGGEDYINGAYLTRYISEDKDEYNRRLDLTPMDNHCRNIAVCGESRRLEHTTRWQKIPL